MNDRRLLRVIRDILMTAVLIMFAASTTALIVGKVIEAIMTARGE